MRKPHQGLDDLDRKILELLQQNGRLSNIELATKLGLAPPSALTRVRRLEARGDIQKYHARVNPASIDLKLLAFIFIKTDALKRENIVGEQISRLPGVLEVHNIAGEDALLVKLRTSGPEELAKLIREDLAAMDGIVSTRTTIVLHTTKESFILPVSRIKGTQNRVSSVKKKQNRKSVKRNPRSS